MIRFRICKELDQELGSTEIRLISLEVLLWFQVVP